MKKALVIVRPKVRPMGAATQYDWPDESRIEIWAASYNRGVGLEKDWIAAGQLRIIAGEDEAIEAYLADPRVEQITVERLKELAPGWSWSGPKPAEGEGEGERIPDELILEDWLEIWEQLDCPEA